MKLSLDGTRFKNFLSYGNKWQEVEFRTGITLITGKDIDSGGSNGSGKSSLLETIPVGLFGKGSRNVPKAEFINWKNKKNCEIINNITINEDKYAILRAIKPDKLEVYKNGKPLDDVAHDKRILQKEIEESLLGIDYKTFMNIIYSNLNNLTSILLMGKPDKRKFLEKVFNLVYFSVFGDKAHKRMNELDKRISDNENTISNNDSNISSIMDQNEDIESRISSMKDSSKELERQEKRLKNLTDKVDIDDLRDKMESIDNESASLSSDVEFIQKKIDRVEQHKRHVSSIIRNQDRKVQKEKELKEELSSMDSVKKEAEEIEFLLLTDEDIEYWIEYIKEKTEEKEKLQESIDRMNENIIRHEAKLRPEIATKSLEGKAKCPTCGSEIDSEKIILEEQQRQEKIKYEIHTLKLNKKYEEDKRDEVEEEIQDAQNILKRHDNNTLQIKELQLQLSKISSIEEKLDEIEKAKAKGNRFHLADKKLNAYVERQIRKTRKITTQIEELGKKREPIAKTIEMIEKIEVQINDLYDKIEQEEKYKNEMRDIIKNNSKKIQDLRKTSNELKKKNENLHVLKDHMKALKSICNDDNIKQYAISTRMPYVTKRTNHYLNTIGFGFYVMLDKWMDHQIKGPGITGKSLKSFSGGESKSVDLALRLALMDSSKISSGIWPDTIIADELLDSSIDSISLNNIMEILRAKQIEDNMKISLVSHREEIEDVDIDNRIEVVKEGGFSRII